ncbi:hypothetical protein CfE428DRAFT_1656 [Chthoniobacter flavus Ellin428]|uniref:Verru_Chthon cassette protein B n=1 Tax=Chthoniobacter flavus Ellin428 TaxID=497964 RepID=B4CYB8_9BACT|nr:Verru_Chthon cassette protein B [Chthoniobacter flavus]EDY20459.1 hypothetical protein CfE428DRAFT_1656 [Chthoniobacter flavus Ellin428]TCO85597.1 uncharacterized protein (TIGR02598 family) [Chthoniobacter flavus]
MKHRSPVSSSSAFTLVEVTLALGIIVFGLLTAVGLLPLGLDSLRASGADTAGARIVEEINSRLEGSDWDQTHNLADFDGQIYYYDNQGNEIPSDTVETVMTAQLSVPSNGASLPSSDATSLNQYLRAVQVKLTSLPAGIPDRFTNQAKYKLVTLLAARISR